MSRVRHSQIDRRTAAAYKEEGGGCLSFYMLAPLSVLFFGGLFAILASHYATHAATLKTNNPSTSLAPLFTPEVQYWSSAISRWAGMSGLDPNIIATIMQIESCGNAFARSSAGALGLFQVMPYHFTSNEDPFDPDTNALRGLTYLRRVFDNADHNISWSLAAYNGGPSLIGMNESMWPAETVRYVYWGGGIYADAARSRSTSQRLNEWLEAGGSSLCQKAHQQLGLP